MENAYKVLVSIPYLNIRKGPGINYDWTGTYTGVGIFLIDAVSEGDGSENGWGKLRNGKGWIALDYTMRI